MINSEEMRKEIERLSADALNAISENNEVKFYDIVSSIKGLSPSFSYNEIIFKILRLLCTTIEDSEGEKEESNEER
ncbi:MAG: hypothetical protein K2L37_00995 [Lactobacillus sp.]|nr:hypothetical protein [Lactobacillus sp.]